MTTQQNNSSNKPKPLRLSKSKRKPKNLAPQKTIWITQPTQEQFSDAYTTIKQIGEPGQFGKAFQIQRKSDREIFAVKQISKARLYRLRPDSTTRQHLLTSMRAEIDIMRRLEHKYIINMYETYETKHDLHIVMEECKGGELFERIKAKGRYPEHEAKPIIKMICEALYYMHDRHRVVHCDLKPDNILFVDETEHSDLKIIDFGMSKVLQRLHSLRELCGTPYYTAPEVIDGKYSHAADMWSVGVITYVMIFGFPPFYVDPNKYYGIRETKEIYKLILKGFDPQIKKGYGAWFPKALSGKLSELGMDFIKLLMEKDDGNRMTAKEALHHPWLKKGSDDKKLMNGLLNGNADVIDDIHPEEKQMDILAAEKLMEWERANKFKLAIAAIFRDQYKNMRPKHFENLKNLFVELDEDGNGTISYKEFEVGMLRCSDDLKLDKNKIQKMFKELDVESKGEIDFDNLLDAVVHDYLVANDVRLYKAFRELDINETGKIKTSDLKEKIKELNPYDNTNMLYKIIDDVDLDKNGEIDYEEFLKALHPDFNEAPKWIPPYRHNEARRDTDNISLSEPEQEHKKELDVVKESDIDNDNKIEDIEDIQDIEDDADMDLANGNVHIVKQGYMQKQGGFVKSWKERWFILESNGVVSYYEKEDSQEPISRFNCKELTKLNNKSWSKTDKKRYGIKLYTPHRDWKFLCKNNQERQEWINAFSKVSGKQIKYISI